MYNQYNLINSKKYYCPILMDILLLRHGESCQQVNASKFERYCDPILSEFGVSRSQEAGLHLNLDKIDLVCSSPMIRSIETAFFMTGGKKDVVVLPYLREVDSHSKTSEQVDKTLPLKSIKIQTEYLEKTGMVDKIHFDLVEDESKRRAFGDIDVFLDWFLTEFDKIFGVDEIPIGRIKG